MHTDNTDFEDEVNIEFNESVDDNFYGYQDASNDNLNNKVGKSKKNNYCCGSCDNSFSGCWWFSFFLIKK